MSEMIKAMTLHTLKRKGEFLVPGSELDLDEAEFKRLYSAGAVSEYSGSKKVENEKTQELDYENLTLDEIEKELNKLTVSDLKEYLEQMQIEYPADSKKPELVEKLAAKLKESTYET